jgi:hypothetical protein
MKIQVEIEVSFGGGERGEEIQSSDIENAVADAVSAVEGIEDYASVKVTKIKVSR